MAHDPNPIHEIPWLRLFPWLRIFRAPGTAADPKILLLSALGLVLMSGGWQVLDALFPASSGITPEVFEAREPIGPDTLMTVPWWLTEPARLLMAPFFEAMGEPSEGDRYAFLHAILAGLWTLIVWGLIGGAVCRIAVLRIFKDQRVGLRESLRFAAKKAGPLIGTPLIPLIGVVLVASCLGGFGLVYRLPSGPLVAGIFGFVPLIGGLILALVVMGLAVSWPLMQASIATEAEDGFDALSRSYAYCRQRPWNLLWYLTVAFCAGALGLIFLDVFAHLVVHLTAWGLSFGANPTLVSDLYHGGEPDVPSTVLRAHAFWIAAVATVVRAWIYGMFWASVSVIYVLLRRDVDGTPLHNVVTDFQRIGASKPVPDGKAKAVPPPHGTPVVEIAKQTGGAD